MAMCLVTFDHEALGHGGMCLAQGGHIRILSSSIFSCDTASIWIDPAGPFANLAVGVLALFLAKIVPRRMPKQRLFLILVTSFSFFWEAGYAIEAMALRHGDLYIAARGFLGEPSLWWRVTVALAGLSLYRFTVRWSSGALSELWPSAPVARGVARTAWIAATLGAALAALAYTGEDPADFRDAVLEIGASAWPLLIVPRSGRSMAEPPAAVSITLNRAIIFGSIAVYAMFVATLGRGLRF